MFIWGLVMAKARAGFTAASSKDQGVVSSGFGKMIGLMFLIGVAGLAKWNADSHFLDNALQPAKDSMSLMSVPKSSVMSSNTDALDHFMKKITN